MKACCPGYIRGRQAIVSTAVHTFKRIQKKETHFDREMKRNFMAFLNASRDEGTTGTHSTIVGRASLQ